jgi:hypothetical protein
MRESRRAGKATAAAAAAAAVAAAVGDGSCKSCLRYFCTASQQAAVAVAATAFCSGSGCVGWQLLLQQCKVLTLCRGSSSSKRKVQPPRTGMFPASYGVFMSCCSDSDNSGSFLSMQAFSGQMSARKDLQDSLPSQQRSIQLCFPECWCSVELQRFDTQ